MDGDLTAILTSRDGDSTVRRSSTVGRRWRLTAFDLPPPQRRVSTARTAAATPQPAYQKATRTPPLITRRSSGAHASTVRLPAALPARHSISSGSPQRHRSDTGKHPLGSTTNCEVGRGRTRRTHHGRVERAIAIESHTPGRCSVELRRTDCAARRCIQRVLLIAVREIRQLRRNIAHRCPYDRYIRPTQVC